MNKPKLKGLKDFKDTGTFGLFRAVHCCSHFPSLPLVSVSVKCVATPGNTGISFHFHHLSCALGRGGAHSLVPRAKVGLDESPGPKEREKQSSTLTPTADLECPVSPMWDEVEDPGEKTHRALHRKGTGFGNRTYNPQRHQRNVGLV